ncbi:hypothetical protein [Erythrobacter sp. F6033]|uniref:hypothetical protein n=1 Tax=Erythrobacter sp. F6033 TaxID=2926401 RepID=UPI001FF31F89|nr:hypothetical protein [Erythrobacter sp. F6033]MCK0128587.1 hypothetical protein [Erythrobacter sp. F6033]
MSVGGTIGAWGAAFALTAASTASALNAQEADQSYISPIAANAENIRSLNIMLMVTSLRCRTGAHDFRGEYDLFARTHQQNLADAHKHLSRNMVATYGSKGPKRTLDRIGVTIANRYGDGHPTLDCSDLKSATSELARTQDRARLSVIANTLLESKASEELAQAPTKAGGVGEAVDAKLTYEQQVLTAPTPQGADGATVKDIPSSKVPIWLRG